MCGNDVCVCDNLNGMENGWMENGLSGCGKWMWKVESGKWKVESGAVPDLTHDYSCCCRPTYSV